MTDDFSKRHGYRTEAPEITVREDAPDDIRAAILLIAKREAMTPHELRAVVCEVLLKRPDSNNWSPYPNVWDEANRLIEDCPWFRVYDIAEALFAYLRDHNHPAAARFQERLNECFMEQGIGWKMDEGKVVFRGSETFSETVAGAIEALTTGGQTAASEQIHEALQAISRRPEPNVTGAIYHAMAALECTARSLTGDLNATLGRLVGRLSLPPPLDVAVEKLWGFASERARHIREGQTVSIAEAEFVVSTACALCTLLTRR
ncbi:MAG: hypothetical protein CMQ43_14520 [Gammaproteobacteria bacterium]|nr:hypothetical protein [Gammaproteobacteria bacterium]|tara:strand:+ start:11887 stop:12669 length:783 start_codon:yes stop_codon:yes gene_type:complete